MTRTQHYGLSFIIMVIFGFLSLWQVKRAYDTYQVIHTAGFAPGPITPEDNYKHTRLEGHFLPHLFIQPRSHQQVPGFQVWAPFQTGDDWVIISLGFMQQPVLPSKTDIMGTIRFLPKPPFRLEEFKAQDSFPITVSQLDLPVFSKHLQHPLSPYVLILDGATELSLQQDDEDKLLKHINYAFQFLLIGLVICYGLGRMKQTKA